MRAFLYFIWEVAEVVLVALIAVFVVRSFLIQPFLVSGSSMEPNFHNGDYLIVDEISYRFREPQRGEVVVFRYPNNESVYFIKRIIGLPGERVIIKNGKVSILSKESVNGSTINEKYLFPYTETSGDKDITLQADEYFVLGDNRNFSFDSRSWGGLKRSEIVGVIRLRLWPLNKVVAFEKPAY